MEKETWLDLSNTPTVTKISGCSIDYLIQYKLNLFLGIYSNRIFIDTLCKRKYLPKVLRIERLALTKNIININGGFQFLYKEK
tara:strand:+ start:102 stop:350 length:249 start_codon:yes stop_codon:yes gene_type:complete